MENFDLEKIEEMTEEELEQLLEAIQEKLGKNQDEQREGDEEEPKEGEEPAEEEVPTDEEQDELENALDAIGERMKALKAEKRAAAASRMLEREAAAKSGKEVRSFSAEKENKNMSEVNYREAWLKNMMGKELSAEERTAVTATAAIPTETMNQIIGILEKNPLIAAVDMTFIPGNVTYPAEGTVNDAAWVAMGTAATDAQDTYTAVTLAAYKLIKTVEITADVQNMAIDAFEGWLVNRLANKIEKAVDAGILNGGGSTSGECLGIKTTKSTQDGTYTKAGMKWKDLCNVIGALKSEYHQNATFVMHRTLFFGDVMAMVDSNGQRVVTADAQAPCKFNILGYPVIVDDNAGTEELYFGDLKAYKFNFAKAPEVQHDDSVAFRTGSRVYRAMALADGKLGDTNAIVRYIRATA